MERPSGTPVMKQTWSELLFLHWPVSVDDLRQLVPAALDIDTFEGRAWVGLVPFTVTGARVSFLPPVPFVSAFHEVNVRTYVRHRGGDPGVWFFSLDASNRLAVTAARQLYKLPYHHARIDMDVTEDGGPPAAPPLDNGSAAGRPRSARAPCLDRPHPPPPPAGRAPRARRPARPPARAAAPATTTASWTACYW